MYLLSNLLQHRCSSESYLQAISEYDQAQSESMNKRVESLENGPRGRFAHHSYPPPCFVFIYSRSLAGRDKQVKIICGGEELYAPPLRECRCLPESWLTEPQGCRAVSPNGRIHDREYFQLIRWLYQTEVTYNNGWLSVTGVYWIGIV